MKWEVGGKNLNKAYQQEKDYLNNLLQHEILKYILISDFEHFKIYDLDEYKLVQFKLSEFVNDVEHFILNRSKVINHASIVERVPSFSILVNWRTGGWKEKKGFSDNYSK